MSLYVDTPIPTNKPSSDQPNIRNNFQVLQQTQDVNHVALSDITNRGKHKFLQMPSQGSAPTTASNEAAVYTKTNSGSVDLYIRRPSSGTEVKLTNALDPGTFGTVATTFLPGGYAIESGVVTNVSDGQIINFLTTYTSCFSVQVNRSSFTGGALPLILDVVYISNVNFQVIVRNPDNSPAGPIDISYMAFLGV